MISAAVLAVSLLINPPALTTHQPDEGFAVSAYKGSHYNPSQEGIRKCIGQREGRFNYQGTGGNGKYYGTYQMTKELVRGAIWMLEKEWRTQFGSKRAKSMRIKLHNTNPRLYSRYTYDAMFYTVLNWNGPLSGLKHWNGGRFHCGNK